MESRLMKSSDGFKISLSERKYNYIDDSKNDEIFINEH